MVRGRLNMPGTAARIVEELRAHNRFLVVSHARPDGDAVGSVLAMGNILLAMGKTVDMVLADAVPSIYRSLPSADLIRTTQRIDPHQYDVAVILECDGTERTGVSGMEDMHVINIDHHRTGREFGALNWIDPEASAVACMVYRLAVKAGVEVTPAMATCLYTALLTDTGSFTYPGTSKETFTLAHELIALGAKADTVARDVLYSAPLARIHLLGVALGRVSVRDAVAWTWTTQSDLERLDATEEESEGIVNTLLSSAGVEAAAILREQPGTPTQYRVSLRSKSDLDVSQAAMRCGGGGHRNAAGCTLPGPFDAAVERLLTELQHELQRCGGIAPEPASESQL